MLTCPINFFVFFRLMRQAYLEIAMVYLHSSEHAHAGTTQTHDQQSITTEGAPPTLEREDSMSFIDDAASVASGFTVQSAATRSSIKSKRKVSKIAVKVLIYLHLID